MDTFARPKFCEQILNLGRAYGPADFWLQNLNLNANPDATWRALMILGAMGNMGLASTARPLLAHRDSRVRAWTCFTLGQLKDEESLEQIHALQEDSSSRVRVHAWQAIQSIVGPEVTGRGLVGPRDPQESLILVSDDLPSNQQVLSNALEQRGYRTLSAGSEEETLRLALEHRPQAIITDNQKFDDNLSGINMTWDICRRPELRETAIFMLSQDPIEPVFLWHGGDYYLPKERLNMLLLLEAINAYLLY